VRTPERQESVAKLLPECEVHVCDVSEDRQIEKLAAEVGGRHEGIHGLVHSIAFANYEEFTGKFHEVSRGDFLQCVSVSCYSLIALANVFKGILDKAASVVAISISTTHMAVESYGYMAPAKAALDSSVAFLAKSFSQFSEVRFNSVCAGLLKTSASAGIPGYAENYLFAEAATLRKRGLSTEEVANAALFLLSPRSRGINAQGIVVDAGMGTNYFDAQIVQHALKGIWPTREP
jgi:enoyl-[acyl-carrier protein] reductase I